MNRTILIGSYPGSPWLADCIRSMPPNYDIIVSAHGGYECGAIGWMHRNARTEAFLFLQDSVILHRHEWLDALDWRTSVALLSVPDVYGSFMGIYQRRVLDFIGVPDTPDKHSAVDAERWWTKQYVEAAGGAVHVVWPDLGNHAPFGERHGRQVQLVGNEHFIKYKSCWDGSMIGSYEERIRREMENERTD